MSTFFQAARTHPLRPTDASAPVAVAKQSPLLLASEARRSDSSKPKVVFLPDVPPSCVHSAKKKEAAAASSVSAKSRDLPPPPRPEISSGAEGTREKHEHRHLELTTAVNPCSGPALLYRKPSVHKVILILCSAVGFARLSTSLILTSFSIDLFFLHAAAWVGFHVMLCELVKYWFVADGADLNAPEVDGLARWSFHLSVARGSLFGCGTIFVFAYLLLVKADSLGIAETLAELGLGTTMQEQEVENLDFFWNGLKYRHPRDFFQQVELCDEIAFPGTIPWSFQHQPCLVEPEDQQSHISPARFVQEQRRKILQVRHNTTQLGHPPRLGWHPRRWVQPSLAAWLDFQGRKYYFYAGDLSNSKLNLEEAQSPTEYRNIELVRFLQWWMLMSMACFVGMMLSDAVNYRGVRGLAGDSQLVLHHFFCVFGTVYELYNNHRAYTPAMLATACAELGTATFCFCALDCRNPFRRAVYRYGMTVSNVLLMLVWGGGNLYMGWVRGCGISQFSGYYLWLVGFAGLTLGRQQAMVANLARWAAKDEEGDSGVGKKTEQELLAENTQVASQNKLKDGKQE